MIEPANKTIDGFEIQISPLPARKGLLVWHRLGKCISPSIGRLLGLFDGGQRTDLAKADAGQLGAAIASLFEACSETDLEFFVKELLGAAIIDHQPFKDVMDIKLQGKILTLLKILVFAVEVNYGDFVGGLRAALAAQASTTTPSTSKPS